MCIHISGQIIVTSHDLTPNCGLVREMGPLISGKSRLVKYYNLTRCIYIYTYFIYIYTHIFYSYIFYIYIYTYIIFIHILYMYIYYIYTYIIYTYIIYILYIHIYIDRY